MPDRISVRGFLEEARDDLSSPTTSNFFQAMTSCRNTVGEIEEGLDDDRNILYKLKKSVKAVHGSAKENVTNLASLAENLEKLGSVSLSREADTGIGTAFLKFSVSAKELSSLQKNLNTSCGNMLLYPLDSLLKGDLKDVKGDMRKAFDKTWKDYETKCTKIEKEKKKIAQDAGFIRTEVTGGEMAEETERERRMFQLQMCEFLIKVNEIKVKEGVELVQHLVEYYHAQISYLQDGLQIMEAMRGYVEELVQNLQQQRFKQDEDRKELINMRNEIKSALQLEPKEASSSSKTSSYSLHGQQGDKIFGTERAGHMLKRSEGLRKVWQKRYCAVKDGLFTIAHSKTSRPTQTLNLLVCQVKEQEEGKKHVLTIVSHNRTFLFQVDDEADFEAWVSVLSNSRKEALERAFGGTDESEDTNSVVHNLNELRQKIVAHVLSLTGNDTCADCSTKEPKWLATNLGVLMCIECSGVHREMGVHVSRIRSIELDKLGTAELLLVKAIGNYGFNEIMESTLDYNQKPSASSKMEERKEFIRSKYIQHKFAQKSGDNPQKILQELHQAVKSRDILAVLQGFAEGVNLSACLPNHPDEATALHVAVEQEDLTSLHILDFLCQNCADVNAVNVDGNTALHIASLTSKAECIRLILRAGGTDSLNKANKDGKTPIEIATDLGQTECIELLKLASCDKLTQCDNVKIDWGLNETCLDGIYEDPQELIDIKDIKAEVSDEETLNDSKGDVKTRTNPPTPPRHRRLLPPRPVSQVILPSRSAASQPRQAVTNSFYPGLGQGAGDSPLMRRKAPAPPLAVPGAQTVAVPIRSSMIFSTTMADALSSTFGHGPKTTAPPAELSASDSNDSPPVPPIRSQSVSREKRHVPLPVPPAENKEPGRRPPPVPPPPKRTAPGVKPQPPPVPTHRRSRSEGRTPFGEDVISHQKMTSSDVISSANDPAPRKSLEKKNSVPLESLGPDGLPPRTRAPGSPPCTTGASEANRLSNGELPGGATPPRAPSSPHPPPRQDSKLTSSGTLERKSIGNLAADDGKDSAAPELPPRLYGTISPSSHPRRVQALYDCEADNEDELTFSEGDIILVSGESDDAEWWIGELEGHPEERGVFPVSFVHVLPD